MSPSVPVLWTLADWARAIADLPAHGPLPVRTVLVPREAVAHALRRELVRLGLGHALAGTRFLPLAAVAAEVLRSRGIAFQPGEEGRRRARLAVLFRAGLTLRHFPLALLRDKPGWDEAFARTLTDLEAAGLRLEDLERDDSPRLGDIARVWRAADESAGASWTLARLLGEAAAVLERSAAAWPYGGGATLAVASGRTTAVEARLIRAIPRVEIRVWGARPVRERYARHVETILGIDLASGLAEAAAPRLTSTERDLLASYLFEPPSMLADPARPRSAGPDGTVDLEEHAGTEEEIEASVDWVARQIADGTPLEEIAILVPALDPLAGLVAERLTRLPWADGALPVHVSGGLPLVGSAAGARALAVMRGLRCHLTGEALAALLPSLETASGERRHLSRGRAMDLVWALGVAGGNPASPSGALEWADRAAQREGELAALLGRSERGDDDDPERPVLARRRRDVERALEDLRAVRPALDALCGVARHVVDGAPLAALWPTLRDFLSAWLIQPGAGPRVATVLDQAIAPLATDAACGALVGEDALRLIEETLTSIRTTTGRFGEPAVYVGTVAGATGLTFGAVRAIGLAEGHLPPVPREDPVLPDALRRALGDAVPTAPDRTLAELHALDAVVRGAARRVALSAPRLDLDRSMREPSFVLLEAAAALGRPHVVTRERGPVVPDIVALRRDAFIPARSAALSARRRMPVSEAAWQDGVAAGVLGRPPRWLLGRALDLDRIALSLQDGAAPGPLDGLFAAGGATVDVPGLSDEWPVSPSALEQLLGCPHRFLLEKLLGLEEPTTAPLLREVGQPAYGGLFHRAAEQLYRKHGRQIAAREGQIDGWLAEADRMVDVVFDEFLREYPLIGEAVRAKERRRLRADLRDLVAYDWETGPRRFVAVERSFGPVRLTLGERALVIRGRIDRLDVHGAALLVRDLKTGRAYPRTPGEPGPDHVRDAQLAAYGLVAGQLAGEWGTPARVAAAYAYFGRAHGERSYRGDFHQVLEPAARSWFALAADLLTARVFPRTPRPDDCTWCAFRPVCGDGAHDRARRVLADADGPLRSFAALKSVEAPAEDDR